MQKELLGRVKTLKTGGMKTPDEWASENIFYSSATGVPGPRNPHLTGYMVPFLRKMAERTHRRGVVVTGSQTGKTAGLLDLIGSRLDLRPTPTLYVGPNDEFVSQQFEPRVVEMLRGSISLRKKTMWGRKMSQKRKLVSGVKLRLASGQSSAALKSDPMGLAIVDEYDEMLANIKGQGDPLGWSRRAAIPMRILSPWWRPHPLRARLAPRSTK